MESFSFKGFADAVEFIQDPQIEKLPVVDVMHGSVFVVVTVDLGSCLEMPHKHGFGYIAKALIRKVKQTASHMFRLSYAQCKTACL